MSEEKVHEINPEGELKKLTRTKSVRNQHRESTDSKQSRTSHRRRD